MADELGPAVTALQRKLDEQLRAVGDTKRTINMLLKMTGQEPLYPDSDSERGGTVRADQFYGRGLAPSAAEYLALRQQACQPEEILRGLQSGGFDFDVLGWKEDDRLRSLAISLAKNTGGAGKFHRLKNGSFGLRSWYDADFLKKAAAGADATAKTKKKMAGGKATKAKGAETEAQADAKPERKKRSSASTAIPYAKIAEMYEAGKDYTEIANATGLYRKDNVYPEGAIANALTQLSKGVTVGGRTIKVERRGRTKTAKKNQANGQKLLPDTKSRPVVDQTARKEA